MAMQKRSKTTYTNKASIDKANAFAEAAVDYHRLIGIEKYQGSFGKPEAKLRVIRAGLPAEALNDLIHIFSGTQDDVANLLNISDKTLRTYIKERRTLDIGISEHLLQLFELFDKGIEIFGNLEQFRLWLKTPNIALEEAPIQLLDSLTGIECVSDELERIAYGALA